MVAAHAALGDGRHVRQAGKAFLGGNRQRLQSPALDLRHHRRKDLESGLDITALQRGDHCRGRLERNHLCVDSRQRFEKFRGEVLGTSDIDRADIELVWIRSRIRDQLAHRADPGCRVDNQDQVEKPHRRDRCKIFDGIVGQRLEQRCAHRVAVGNEEKGITIRLGFGDSFGRDDSPGARAVLDDHLLSHRLAHFLRKDPGRDVSHPTGSKRHDDLDRVRRVSLRQSAGRERNPGGVQALQHAIESSHGTAWEVSRCSQSQLTGFLPRPSVGGDALHPNGRWEHMNVGQAVRGLEFRVRDKKNLQKRLARASP